MPDYITLKEASKISGYTPDYLGQLIRKGKLEGKQIYLNVAWVTTEKALKQYLEDDKAGTRKADLGMMAKGKVRRWFIRHSSGDEIIRIARKVMYGVIVLLAAFCLFLLYALLANLFHA